MLEKELTEGCQNYAEQVLMDRGGLQKAENENCGFYREYRVLVHA